MKKPGAKKGKADKPVVKDVGSAGKDGAKAKKQKGGKATAAEKEGKVKKQKPAGPTEPVAPPVASVFRRREQKEHDPFTALLERRVDQLFEALDMDQSGHIDVQELGTLMRAMGCCPGDSELQEVLTRLEEETQPGLVRLETVRPFLLQCIEDRKYRPAPEDQVRRAFQALLEDEDKVLTQDKLVHILTEEGEHLSQQEVEEMLTAVTNDPDTGGIDVDAYVKQLIVPELW